MNNLKTIDSYRPIVGEKVIDEIHKKAKLLKNKRIVCISSTHTGGGVAEMYNALVPIYNDLGIRFGWRILHGTNNFFEITKDIHNGLQGQKVTLSQAQKKTYLQTNARYSQFTHLDHDLVLVHDPQPLPMIASYKKKQPWIFRIHPDFTRPYPDLYRFLKKYIDMYDQVIVSKEEYIKKDLKPIQSIIYPAIDPLALKNKFINATQVERELSQHGVIRKKVTIAQVSRFDKWKGFPELIRAFELSRKVVDAQLLLCGSYASDDPEGRMIYEQVVEVVNKSPYKKDIQIVFGDNELFVNAIQRGSDIIVQNSSKEGFGLTVSEALYKETPVIATKVGGIPLQVIDNINGLLVDPGDVAQLSQAIITLTKDKKLRKKMGTNGKEYVTKNFLITRLMIDWLDLFIDYLVFPKNAKYLRNKILSHLKNGHKIKKQVRISLIR